MLPANEVNQLINRPYVAFAVGMGLFVFGLGVYEAVDDEKMTRETVESYADETREVGGGFAARIWEVTDSLQRDHPEEDTSLDPAEALAAGALGGVVVTGAFLWARPHVGSALLQGERFFRTFGRWNLRFGRRHLPDAVTGHALYGEYTALIRTIYDSVLPAVRAEFGYVLAGTVLLTVVWVVYGQVSVVLLEEYA